ncbi:TIGR04222 domain-containing membrane protein [Plantactinospora sp. KLBMP9567]|uniref:TIGR04222 domain-containing membrane protein n=1 Tax=Plantactinospora sp. KLBMP9567 TaxID=3085900 RepID=UPI0029825B94|nr:TIGR04222 domain-containing membrane protein [Plantactinospora sp. KLBMP9567]MDW5328131.1 TIGR04222 domain-containing membrane protein [Plantactinospora sp. KLBMP9567]
MDALTVQAETWDVPGPVFLTLYLTIAGLVLLGTLLHRLVGFAGRRPPGAERLHPVQLAWLSGGDRLAVHATLGGLRAAGAVGTTPQHRLTQTGPLPIRATLLDAAIHRAAAQGIRGRALDNEPRVRAALADLRADLARSGLALSPSARPVARIGPVLLLGLVAVGLARLVAGLAGGQPVGYLGLSLLVLAPTSVVLLCAVPRRTRAANALLRDLRGQHQHLAPRHSPAYATYGAAGAALGIALFGTAALVEFDPAFAVEAEVQRAMSGSAAGGSGWTAGSTGDGSGGDSSGGGGSGGGGCGGGCGGCGGCGG